MSGDKYCKLTYKKIAEINNFNITIDYDMIAK